MREGVDNEGQYLYPAFPYDHFTKITDDDMHALYAYIMSLDPIEYTPPDNELGFPFNIRLTLAGWNLLFLDKSRWEPRSNPVRRVEPGLVSDRRLGPLRGLPHPAQPDGRGNREQSL